MPGAVFLEGDKVNLRTIEEEDIEFLGEVNNPVVWKNISSITEPQNKQQLHDFFDGAICSEEGVHLAICDDEEMKGVISLNPEEEGLAVIGLWVAEEHHGNGYGTEASEIMTDYAFDQLRYHKLMARVYEENEASQRIWEKLGYEKEAELKEHAYRNGEYEDVYIYRALDYEWRN